MKKQAMTVGQLKARFLEMAAELDKFESNAPAFGGANGGMLPITSIELTRFPKLAAAHKCVFLDINLGD